MIVTLEEMKNYLGITSNDSDTFLTEQIILASEAIEAYCARKFEQATYVETFYRDEWLQQNQEISKKLHLYCFPVQSVTSVEEFADEEDLTGQVVSGYRLHPQTGTLTRMQQSNWFYNTNYWWTGTEKVVVTYVGGYVNIPAPVKQVAYSVVSERYNKKQAGIDLNFGSDVQKISIPGSISIDFDYSLQNNDRKSAFGVILGANLNILDYYRSERAVVHSSRLEYFSVS